MDAFKEKALSSSDPVQDLLRKIPGYAGYQDRERRRDVDKILRTFLADDLKKEKGRLMDCSAAMARKAKLDYVAEVDRVGKIFEKVIDKIRHADYGYSGMFGVVKINEAELDRIYDFDMALAQYTSVIGETLTALQAGFDSGEGIGDKLRDVEKYIREFDHKFDDREKTIMGVA